MFVTKQKYFDYQVSKWRENDKSSGRQKYLTLRNKDFSKDYIRVRGGGGRWRGRKKKKKEKKFLQIGYKASN